MGKKNTGKENMEKERYGKIDGRKVGTERFGKRKERLIKGSSVQEKKRW